MSRGFPSMTALLGLLAVAGYQNRDKIAEMLKNIGKGGETGTAANTPGQGKLEGLGGLLGGLTTGNLLNGGIGELLERFQTSGQKETADSWIGTGPNRDVAPNDLKKALGPDVLQSLVQSTGLSEEELLSRLSRELPTAVDKYTPEGRVASA